MVSKIKIKLGPVEIEFEGDEQFFKDEIPQLLSEISEILKDPGISKVIEDVERASTGGQLQKPKIPLEGTVLTYASKLGGKSGSDLIIATAAHLTFAKHMDTFTREQLHTGMKTATGYYKQSYSKNLTANLTSVIKAGKLTEISTGTYSLSATTKTELENALGISGG